MTKLWVLLLMAGMAGLWSATAVADETASPVGAAADRARATKLLDQFTKPKITSDEREQVVAKLLELGEDGPRRLLPLVSREFRSKGPAYLAHYEQAAAELVRSRFRDGRHSEAEVAELRRQVLSVSRGKNITKEAIVQTCDPARKKLEELLAVTPDEVFEHDPKIKTQREQLLTLRSWWEQAAAKLPDSKRDPVPKPPDQQAVENGLQEDEQLAAVMATPMSAADRAVLMNNRASAKLIDSSEAAGILDLNLLRVRLGIGALAIDPKLCSAARGHSKDMHDNHYFSHDSPTPGQRTPWDRARAAGTSASAENIAEGAGTPEGANELWWHSPGHHVNMMGAHHRIGLGHDHEMWTQMFGQ